MFDTLHLEFIFNNDLILFRYQKVRIKTITSIDNIELFHYIGKFKSMNYLYILLIVAI